MAKSFDLLSATFSERKKIKYFWVLQNKKFFQNYYWLNYFKPVLYFM